MEHAYDSLLIIDVSFFAHKRIFHFVESTFEVLFVLRNKQLADVLQFAFSVCDTVDLDALYKHLDQGCTFGEFCPSQG